MEEIKYFIYARKSTKSDDRQALSIPAQLRALNKIAQEQRLTVVETVTERESAHAPGRSKFNSMLARIEAGKASGILAWHPDRLARNSKDGGDIIYLLDIGKLANLKFSTFWFENTPQGKGNLGHEFVQSKQFSDKLSSDTKRGLAEKAQSGCFPGRAPRGYLNNPANKTIVLDPEIAPVIKALFERYAKGDCTLEGLCLEFADQGLLTQPNKQWKSAGGNLLRSDLLRRILSNPFYYGHFTFAGELFEGKHPALITKALFDKVQKILSGRAHRRWPTPSPKPYTGLLWCASCGMMITAEVQKGRVYYRCTKKSKSIICPEPYVREEELDRQITRLLLDCCLPEGWPEQMLLFTKKDHLDFLKNAEAKLSERRQALEEANKRVKKLLSAYLEGLVDQELFIQQKNQLLKEKKNIQEQITACEIYECPWLEPLTSCLKMAQNQRKIAISGSPQEKKALAAVIYGSNLTLSGKKARGKAVKLWSLFQEKPLPHSLVRSYASARPLYHDWF